MNELLPSCVLNNLPFLRTRRAPLHNLHIKRLSMRAPSFDSAECFLSLPPMEHIYSGLGTEYSRWSSRLASKVWSVQDSNSVNLSVMLRSTINKDPAKSSVTSGSLWPSGMNGQAHLHGFSLMKSGFQVRYYIIFDFYSFFIIKQV